MKPRLRVRADLLELADDEGHVDSVSLLRHTSLLQHPLCLLQHRRVHMRTLRLLQGLGWGVWGEVRVWGGRGSGERVCRGCVCVRGGGVCGGRGWECGLRDEGGKVRGNGISDEGAGRGERRGLS